MAGPTLLSGLRDSFDKNSKLEERLNNAEKNLQMIN